MGGGPLATMAGFQSAQTQQASANLQHHLNQQNAQADAISRAGSVPSTAASRVQKAAWEQEEDRKDCEVDEMIERQRQERERVRIEEESGNDPRGED